MALWEPADSFQPETLEFLKQNETWEPSSKYSSRKDYSCRCTEVKDEHYHLCEFHEGFDCGVAYMKEKHAREEESGTASRASG